MKSHLVLFTLAVGGALLLSGCTAPDNGDAVVVEMKGSQFVPKELEVEPGTTVKWINRDSIQHNVVSDDGSFEGMSESKMLNGGQTFEHTFDEPGVYTYHCHPHAFEDGAVYQGMVGTIIVLNEDGSMPMPGDGGDGGNETNNNGTA